MVEGDQCGYSMALTMLTIIIFVPVNRRLKGVGGWPKVLLERDDEKTCRSELYNPNKAMFLTYYKVLGKVFILLN